jgi:hypothetical protein
MLLGSHYLVHALKLEKDNDPPSHLQKEKNKKG